MHFRPSPDPGADVFDAVVDRQHANVYRYAYRLTGCVASAEDIAQEVFLKAFRNFHQLRDPQAERAWLLAITRNEFSRWLRQRAGRVSLASANDVELQCGENQSPEARLVESEWVQAALAELSDEYRVVLLMYYFEDLPYAEISDKLQIPIGTVMSRLNRGRNHLRRHLNEIAAPRGLALSE